MNKKSWIHIDSEDFNVKIHTSDLDSDDVLFLLVSFIHAISKKAKINELTLLGGIAKFLADIQNEEVQLCDVTLKEGEVSHER